MPLVALTLALLAPTAVAPLSGQDQPPSPQAEGRTITNYALLPVKFIPQSRPVSWNRTSQSLALFGTADTTNRSSLRGLLRRGGRMSQAYDQKVLRWSLEPDRLEEVFVASSPFSLRQVKWLGLTSDLAFSLEDVAGQQTGVAFARQGQQARLLDNATGAKLVTVATSTKLPVLVTCFSSAEAVKITLIGPQASFGVTGLPDGTRVATVRESRNSRFVELEALIGSASEETRKFGIDLESGRLIPFSGIPEEDTAKASPILRFELRQNRAPGDSRELQDVFAVSEDGQSRLLMRGALTMISSPDGLKAAVWDGSATHVFEFVQVQKPA